MKKIQEMAKQGIIPKKFSNVLHSNVFVMHDVRKSNKAMVAW